MTQIWIVHRHERERAALRRLAAEADAVVGAPSDPQFDAAPPAEVVLLGLADDWEAELEFAHRQRDRLRGARWLLVGPPADAEAARTHFDLLAPDYLPYPPPRETLQQRLTGHRRPLGPTLSERVRRDAVSERFSRWLADLELPDLLRAMDPRLADLPMLVRGEAGSGRGALIRYAHQFGAGAEGPLLHVACDAETAWQDVSDALERAAQRGEAGPALCVWLDELGRLRPRQQRELAAWIAAGAPSAGSASPLRWVASVDPRDPGLEPELAALLGTLVVELPPLREREGHLESIALETAAWWARRRNEPRRHFAADALAAMKTYPWPGNLLELESVLLATLAHTRADPIGADALRFPGADDARPHQPLDLGEGREEPLDVASIGELLPDGPEAAAAVERAGASPSDAEPRPAAVPPAPEPPRAPPGDEDEGLRRLANALSVQVRNPLATIRSFAELLPERFDDPEFRERFAEMLREDVGRLHGLLGRVDQLGALDAPERDKVDLAELLEELLEGRREEFRERHLLVLKELDPGQSMALADPDHLRVAFEALLDKALSMIPEHGDLYLASRRHAAGESGLSSTRVLLRFHDPLARDRRAAAEHSLELLIAELLVRAQGGRLTLGASDAEERLLVVDLPAP